MSEKTTKKHFVKITENQKNWKNTAAMIALSVALFGVIGVFAAKNGKAVSSTGPLVKINLTGEITRAGEKIPLKEAQTVKPAEILHWTIRSKNEGTGEASEYKAVGKIPAGTVYIAGSAAGEKSPLVKFSIDGGRNFSEKPVLREKQPDGSVKEIPAPVEKFTDVRFEWSNPLAPGEKRDASYRVLVK